MSTTPVVRPDPLPLLALVGIGTAALVAGATAGGNGVVYGAAAFLGTTALALVLSSRDAITWQNALLVFVGVLWFVPIKLYRLPFDLPFGFELYRVLLLMLVLAFVVSSLTTNRPVETLGVGKPLFVLTGAVVTTQIIHASGIDTLGNEGQSLKSLSLVLSMIVVFLLFASTVDTFRQIETIVMALVAGGSIVAVTALYEGHSLYNVFNHLSEWIPIFERNEREVLALRGGRLRVHASAQHPIALGAALIMLLPLAYYLASRARTRAQAGLWIACMVVLCAGAAATVSRTTIAMGIAMAIVAYRLRRQAVIRLLPLVLVLPFVVHTVAPGAIGGILNSFEGEQEAGFVESISGRAGEGGSGRLTDVQPALDLWIRSPLIGIGIDNPEIATAAATPVSTASQNASVPLIFDNQYLHALVTMGLVGLAGLLWLIWGTVVKTARGARRVAGDHGDFIAAASVSCAGYGASLLFFDALAFIQVTLLFFITAALGLKAVSLSEASVGSEERPELARSA